MWMEWFDKDFWATAWVSESQHVISGRGGRRSSLSSTHSHSLSLSRTAPLFSPATNSQRDSGRRRERKGQQWWRSKHEEEKARPVMKLPWPPILLPMPSLPPRTVTLPGPGRLLLRRDPCLPCSAPDLLPATHSFLRLIFASLARGMTNGTDTSLSFWQSSALDFRFSDLGSTLDMGSSAVDECISMYIVA